MGAAFSVYDFIAGRISEALFSPRKLTARSGFQNEELRRDRAERLSHKT